MRFCGNNAFGYGGPILATSSVEGLLILGGLILCAGGMFWASYASEDRSKASKVQKAFKAAKETSENLSFVMLPFVMPLFIFSFFAPQIKPAHSWLITGAFLVVSCIVLTSTYIEGREGKETVLDSILGAVKAYFTIPLFFAVPVAILGGLGWTLSTIGSSQLYNMIKSSGSLRIVVPSLVVYAVLGLSVFKLKVRKEIPVEEQLALELQALKVKTGNKDDLDDPDVYSLPPFLSS